MSAGHDDPFHHVRDFDFFELPGGGHIALPEIPLGFTTLHITKFMVLQVVAALLAFLVFRGLARRIQGGKPAQGRFWNFWEMLALGVRDQVVRPSVGVPHHHDDGHGHDAGGHGHDHGRTHGSHAATGEAALAHPADRFLPFIWSLFFYILFCNLLGAIPLLGAATGNTGVTSVLALSTLGIVIAAGVQQSGAMGFFKSLAPPMDLPGPAGLVLWGVIWVIEFVGLFIKHTVLAIRLFANLMAGHVVIGVFLSFIASTAGSPLWYLVTPASIFGQIAIGALELFVAFLQAYVFALLASIFIGAAVNPH